MTLVLADELSRAAFDAAEAISPADIEELCRHAYLQAGYGHTLPYPLEDNASFERAVQDLEAAVAAQAAADELALVRSPERAFADASAIPGRATWNNAAANAAWKEARVRAGFPAETVAGWLPDAHRQHAADVARRLSEHAEVYLSRLSPPRRGAFRRDYAAPSDFRVLLARSAAAAETLADCLEDIRDAARRPGQAATDFGAQAREVYRVTGAGLLCALLPPPRTPEALRQRQRLLDQAAPRVRTAGDAYAGATTNPVAGLRDYANSLRRYAQQVQIPAAVAEPRTARTLLVKQLGAVWRGLTGVAPSAKSGGPFHRFCRSYFGFLAGVVAREHRLSRDDERRSALMDELRRVGLDSIPSAATLKRDLMAR